MNKNKVVHLTSVHSPFDVRIFHKECKTLAKEGYDVYLVAQGNKDEEREGVQILAVPKAKTRLERMTVGIWKVFSKACAVNGNIYHFHDPELIPVGILLKFRGKKVIYDVHEDLPRQILAKSWIPRGLRWTCCLLARVVEAGACLFFDRIIAVTPTIARRFPARMTILVQNFPLAKEFLSEGGSFFRDRPERVVFIGGITAIRGIREMVEAIGLFPEESAPRLILAGEFTPPELKDEMSAMPGWKRVDYVGIVDREQVMELLSNARVGLVLFAPVPNHLNAQPNKLFEYMSSGLPVVASDFPLWREIVLGNGCGLVADPQSPQSIYESLAWILLNPEGAEEMGRRGRDAVMNRYRWESEEKKLLALYRELCQ